MCSPPSADTLAHQIATPRTTTQRMVVVNHSPYRLEMTPLCGRDKGSRRNRFAGLVGRSVWAWAETVAAKLFSGRLNRPTPLREYTTAVPLAVAPVVGDTASQLSVTLQSVTPGRWQGEAATLLLFEFTHHDRPLIPSIKLELRLQAADEKPDHLPLVAAAGPGRVNPEQQTRSSQPDRQTIEVDRLIHGKKSSKHHDKVSGLQSGDYLDSHGVMYRISGAPHSKNGVPTELKLAVICQFDGVAVIRADIKAGDTWRKLTLRRGDRCSVSFDHGDYMERQALDCRRCDSTENCRDFSHLNEEFWYTLLHQPTFRERVPVEFSQGDSDLWLRTFVNGDQGHEVV